MADATYIEPITLLLKSLKKSVQMQSYLRWNCIELRTCTWWKWRISEVELIGATKEAIEKAEDRKTSLCAKSVWNVQKLLLLKRSIGNPISLWFPSNYPSSMGGSGGGIAYNREEFLENVVSTSLLLTNYWLMNH